MADITVLPSRSDPRWRDVATGKITKPWQALALKIMLTRVINSTKTDPSPANLDKAVDDIRAFFEKNLQNAQGDLQSIFQ